MLRSRRTFLALSILSFSFALLPSIVRADDAFEGKWKVKLEPDDDARKSGERDVDDTLTFTANKFSSDAMKQRGFDAANYDEDTRRFGPATFTAEASSDKAGKAKWSGTVTATELEGELTITKPDGSTVHFTYKGEKS